MFSIFESSRYKSKPFFLLMIRFGPGANDFYAFTDNEFPVTVNGIEYVVRQFDLGEIATTGSMDRSAVPLRTPRTNELFELFRIYPPSYRVTMTVMKSHYGDPDKGVVTIWSGRVLGMTVRGSECEFNCEPISTTMKRLGLRRNWQYGCPHALYQNGCNASKPAVAKVATVVSNADGKLTLSAAWNGALDASKFIGGFVELPGTTTLSRTILRVEGNVLTVSGTVAAAPAGTQVTVYPGCAHNMDDCQNVHGNILNFGGQPWIPSDNPVGAKNNFY